MSLGKDLSFSSLEASNLTGVSLRQLQWWDEQGLVAPTRRGGRRSYQLHEVIEVALIAELRRKGLSLQKTRRMLRRLDRELGGRLFETVTNGGEMHLLTDGRTVAPLDPHFQLLGGGLEGSIGASWSWCVGLFAIGLLGVTTLRARRARNELGSPTKPLAIEIGLLALWSGMIVAFVLVMNAYTQPRSPVARGIPVPVLILIAVAALMRFLAQRTRFGRHVFAIGGSPVAAELAGIDVRRVTLRVFALMGLLCGVSAVLVTARLGAGANSMGTLAELNVIAAAVIGGTSLAGGRGTIAGAILGAVIMQSLENGMVLLGVSSPARQVAIGLALIVAVWLDSVYRHRQSGRTA